MEFFNGCKTTAKLEINFKDKCSTLKSVSWANLNSNLRPSGIDLSVTSTKYLNFRILFVQSKNI